MKENDFQMNSSGRSGSITYQSADKKIKVYWEMSGAPEYDILLAPIDLKEWNEPKGVKIQLEMQKDILQKLRKWTKEQKLKTDIDLPNNLEFEEKPCAWMGCNEHRLKGSAYCSGHYDENLLRK
jgi:hypothetical protein